MAWAPDWKSWHSCPRRVCGEHRGWAEIFMRCTPNNCWLVVSTPLNHISQLGLLFPIYMEKSKVFQTTNELWRNDQIIYPNAPWCWNIHQHLPSKSLKCSYIHHAWSIWVMALLLIKCVPTTSPNGESRNSIFVLVCVAWTTGLGCIGSGSRFGNPWQTAKSKPQVHDTHTHTSKGARHSSRTILERPSLKANQTWQETYPFDPFAIGKTSMKFKK
jgi:hypothetical protein